MQAKIEEAFAHLGAILMQTATSDDKIIIGHVRDAHGLLQDALRAPSPRGTDLDARQEVVIDWGRKAFGADHMADKIVRAARFIEEAAEMVQAVGLTKDHAQRALDHVYSRPPGDPKQEAGGSANTLMALCGAVGLSLDECQRFEIERCLAKDPAHFAARNQVKIREVDAAPSVAENEQRALLEKRFADRKSSSSVHDHTFSEGASPAPSTGEREAWQPIETAPRDGTAIFAYWTPTPQFVGDIGELVDVVRFTDGQWWGGDEFEDDYARSPTHWKPVGAPPVISPQPGKVGDGA